MNRVENLLWSESQRRAAVGQGGWAGVGAEPDLDLPGWEEWAEWARACRDRYEASLRTLLDTYGIEEEAQLVSSRSPSLLSFSRSPLARSLGTSARSGRGSR